MDINWRRVLLVSLLLIVFYFIGIYFVVSIISALEVSFIFYQDFDFNINYQQEYCNYINVVFGPAEMRYFYGPFSTLTVILLFLILMISPIYLCKKVIVMDAIACLFIVFLTIFGITWFSDFSLCFSLW